MAHVAVSTPCIWEQHGLPDTRRSCLQNQSSASSRMESGIAGISPPPQKQDREILESRFACQGHCILAPCILDEGFWIQPYLVLEPKAKIGVATIGSFVQGVMTLVVGIGQIDAFFPQPGTGLLHSCQGCKDASCRRQEISGSLLAQPGAHLDVPTPRSQL